MIVNTNVLSYLKLERTNSVFNFRFFDDSDVSEDENSLPGILLYIVKHIYLVVTYFSDVSSKI